MQFVILGIHFLAAALTPGCEYPRILSVTGLAIALMFFALFITFYKETYIQKQNEGQIPESKVKKQQALKDVYNKKGFTMKLNVKHHDNDERDLIECTDNNNTSYPNQNIRKRLA